MDTYKFYDFPGLIEQLHDKDIRVILWYENNCDVQSQSEHQMFIRRDSNPDEHTNRIYQALLLLRD